MTARQQELQRIGEVFKAAYFSEDAKPGQTEAEYQAGLVARKVREAERKVRKLERELRQKPFNTAVQELLQRARYELVRVKNERKASC